jgi:ribosomal protein S18 acetylase RimI-like enzyme
MMANQAAVRFYERNGYRRHRVELEKRLDDSAPDGNGGARRDDEQPTEG